MGLWAPTLGYGTHQDLGRERCVYWINSKESPLASVTAGGLAMSMCCPLLLRVCVREYVI
jgi:hypothetical protein